MNKPNPSKKERTRNKIIDAGLNLFQNPGYFNTDIRAIAAKAEVSLGSFYNYFKDKLSLYLTIYKEEHNFIFDDFVNTIKEQSTPLNENSIFHYLLFQLKAHKHSKTFYIEADLLALLEPEVKKLQDDLDSKAVQALFALFPLKSNQHMDVEIALPLLYKLVENTIHSITEEHPDKQKAILLELSRMIYRYISY